MCSEDKLSKAQQKTNKIWVENIFTETELPVQNIKTAQVNCLLNSIQKRKTKAEKANDYQMILSFKTSITYKTFF